MGEATQRGPLMDCELNVDGSLQARVNEVPTATARTREDAHGRRRTPPPTPSSSVLQHDGPLIRAEVTTDLLEGKGYG